SDLPPAGGGKEGGRPGTGGHERVSLSTLCPPPNPGATASAQGPLGPFPPLGGGVGHHLPRLLDRCSSTARRGDVAGYQNETARKNKAFPAPNWRGICGAQH